ncbi:MAG: ATP-binding protein, partial [Acidobacteriota bacterium]
VILLLVGQLDEHLQSGWLLRTSVEDLMGDLEAEICFQVLDENREQVDGELMLQPIGGRTPGARLSPEAQTLDPDTELDLDAEPDLSELGEPAALEPSFCLPREWFFDADTEALMVRSFEAREPGPVLRTVRTVVGAWALGSLVLVLWAAYRLAARPVALVADLSQARARIDQGDLSVRLRRRGEGGDLETASGEVNAILARLDYAVSTLEDVSDNIAHDLRTPLTRLHGQLDLLRRSETPTPTMIEAVQEEAGQLLSTFNALLRIAQVESGTRRQGFKDFDLVPVITDVGELYGPAMAEGSLAFSCQVPSGPVVAHGDPDLWMQALSNLLDNALKYTTAGSRVDLALEAGVDGGGARIRLDDTGDGIPEAELERVFRRFYRLSA